MPHLEINYISPISGSLNNDTCYLVILKCDGMNELINCVEINGLNNVTNKLRAYYIGKYIDGGEGKFSVRLFRKRGGKIELMYVGEFEMIDEIGTVRAIMMYGVGNILRNGIHWNDETFLSEQYFNYEIVEKENKCALFVREMSKCMLDKMDSSVIDGKGLIYNRYYGNFMKEFGGRYVGNDYDDYVKKYCIDVRKYVERDKGNFRDMFVRKIKDELRIGMSNDHNNNMVVSPCDSRVSIIKGGFKCRTILSDYPRVCVPYQGYLIDVVKKEGYISFNFVNDYFIPSHVEEREYISVVLGHNINVSRGYPELVDVQPNTLLNYSLIVKGKSIVVINKKKKKLWFEQGEEMCVFDSCVGDVYVVFNRPFRYSADVGKYCSKGIECYVRFNDNIGRIY